MSQSLEAGSRRWLRGPGTVFLTKRFLGVSILSSDFINSFGSAHLDSLPECGAGDHDGTSRDSTITQLKQTKAVSHSKCRQGFVL